MKTNLIHFEPLHAQHICFEFEIIYGGKSCNEIMLGFKNDNIIYIGKLYSIFLEFSSNLKQGSVSILKNVVGPNSFVPTDILDAW